MIINEKNYKKEIIRCKKPVLLGFMSNGYSSFLLKNTIDALCEDLNGIIKVGIVDSKSAGLFKIYNARFLPCSLLIKNNTVIQRIVGNLSREGFLGIIQTSL